MVMGMLVRVIGLLPAVAGLSVTVIMIPLGTLLTRRLAVLRREQMTRTDARLKLTSEVVSGDKYWRGEIFAGT